MPDTELMFSMHAIQTNVAIECALLIRIPTFCGHGLKNTGKYLQTFVSNISFYFTFK